MKCGMINIDVFGDVVFAIQKLTALCLKGFPDIEVQI